MDVVHIVWLGVALFVLHPVNPSSDEFVKTAQLRSATSIAINDLKTLSNNSSRTVDFLRKKIKAMQENKKNDLVFLIDSSFSVGNANFRSEVKFVRKVLNGFKVSFNFTRVAVVPFSSSKRTVSVTSKQFLYMGFLNIIY